MPLRILLRPGAMGRVFAVLLAAAVAWTAVADPASAYDPKDAKVQGLLNKAIAFLESAEPTVGADRAHIVGSKVLAGYAIYKHRKDPNHPKVREAVDEAAKFFSQHLTGPKQVYELGLAISLLSEMEDPRLHQLAGQMCQQVLKWQKPSGAFAYEGPGDTSVTQYAMLAMWSARHGKVIQVPDEAIARTCNWLLRTQAPSGMWAYHGKDPGNYTRITQDYQPTLACFVAGAGSLYIAADLLGFEPKQKAGSPFISADAAQGGQGAKSVNEKYLWASLDLADRYWATSGKLVANRWQHYYMYGQERYMSFRSEVRGIEEPAGGPDWYNAGVNYLAKNQASDGSWRPSKNTPTGPIIDTSLASLFLMRSTKEKIAAATHGVALGGIGVPKNFTVARQGEDGRVIAPENKTKVEDLSQLIRTMQADSNFDPEAVDVTAFLQEKQVEKSQLDQMKDMVANEPSYQKRLVAVRVLAQGGLENAPVLIFALSDPDYRVSTAARDALRLMSRKLQGFGLPEQATEEQKKLAQDKWRQWLRTVRPDIELQ